MNKACGNRYRMCKNEDGEIPEYGIEYADENGVALMTLKNISSAKSTVEAYVDLLNENEVSIYHFRDVIEDLLC